MDGGDLKIRDQIPGSWSHIFYSEAECAEVQQLLPLRLHTLAVRNEFAESQHKKFAIGLSWSFMNGRTETCYNKLDSVLNTVLHTMNDCMNE